MKKATTPPQPLQPTARRTPEEILELARVPRRYAGYDMAAAELRLRRKLAVAKCPVVDEVTASMVCPQWTDPLGQARDVERAGCDLEALIMVLLLERKAQEQLACFIDQQYTDRAGARVFACLLHLSGYQDGARFWWQYAAGAGDGASEYLLFLDHARRGEFRDALYWGHLLRLRDFTPDFFWGPRDQAPVLAGGLSLDLEGHIAEVEHPVLGAIPLPEPELVQDLREFTAIAPG